MLYQRLMLTWSVLMEKHHDEAVEQIKNHCKSNFSGQGRLFTVVFVLMLIGINSAMIGRD